MLYFVKKLKQEGTEGFNDLFYDITYGSLHLQRNWLQTSFILAFYPAIFSMQHSISLPLKDSVKGTLHQINHNRTPCVALSVPLRLIATLGFKISN